MPPLSWCFLRAPAVWRVAAGVGNPVGVRGQLIKWPVPVCVTGVTAPRSQGGALGGVVPPPLLQAVGRPRVRGVLSPRQQAGPDPGREAVDELDVPSAAWWGSV